MIAELFFGFSVSLFLVRLICYKSLGMRWVATDALSGTIMWIAFYFFVFPPQSIATISTVSGSTVTNTIVTTTTPGVPINSGGFILLLTITFFWTLIMTLWALRDLLSARNMSKLRQGDLPD